MRTLTPKCVLAGPPCVGRVVVDRRRFFLCHNAEVEQGVAEFTKSRTLSRVRGPARPHQPLVHFLRTFWWAV
jgi:hypothetical protein